MDWFVKKTIKSALVIVPSVVAFHTLFNSFLTSKEPGQFLKTALYILLAVLAAVALFCYLRYFVSLRKEKGFPYVYVNSDGSVREVTESEQDYLSTAFSPADGGRPYIKNRYDQQNASGSIKGFIYRDRVPAKIPVLSATAEVSS
ncbi:MAG: hypothetical protein ACRYFX_02585 [Janthinobacterium lividum]